MEKINNDLQTEVEKAESLHFEDKCIGYRIYWARYDKKTLSLIQDGFLTKQYKSLRNAICALKKLRKSGPLVERIWKIIGYDDDKYLCVYNEEKRILEDIYLYETGVVL